MRPKTEQGFTLIELMVVVVILSVLTVVAVASFQRYQRSARRGEAIELMNDIRIKQESFFAHYSRYVSAPSDDPTVFTGVPGGDGAAKMFVWNIDCTNTTTGTNDPWCQLGFRPKGAIINGVADHLWFQLQTSGWRPGGPAAPSFIPNATNAYWLSVQARAADENGGYCTLIRLSNQVKDAMIFDQHTDCPGPP